VFALGQDGVSEPVQGPFGLQILKVTAIQASKTPSFEDVRGELAQDAARAGDRFWSSPRPLSWKKRSAAACRSRLPPRDLGLEHFKIAAVDAEGQDPNDNPVQGLPAAPFSRSPSRRRRPGLAAHRNQRQRLLRAARRLRPAARARADAVRGQ
jgi:hypothetical protein